MIYFIFWMLILGLKLNKVLVLSVLILTLALSPKGQRRFIIYALLIASAVIFFQTSYHGFNTKALPSSAEGYIYNIDKNKADIYINHQKYRLKCRGLSNLDEGQQIVLKNIAKQRQKTLNRHSYNIDRHYYLMGYKGYIKGEIKDRLKREDPHLYRRITHQIKNYILSFSRHFSPSAKTLIKALIIGQIDDMSLKNNIKELGLIHLFVISGYHFTAMTMILFFILYHLFKLPYRQVMIAIIFISILYFGVVKAGYGSQRAVLGILLVFCCFLFKRRADMVNITLIYVMIRLVINVEIIYALGFQLTTLSTCLVVIASRWTKGIAQRSNTMQALFISGFVYILISACIIYSSGNVAVIGILLIPLLTPLISCFIVLCILGLIIPIFAKSSLFILLLNTVATIIYDWIHFTQTLAHIKLSYPPIIALVIVFFIIGFMMSYILKSKGWHIISGIILSGFICGVFLLAQVDIGFSMRTYALYDGDAYLIRAPGAVMLYDVGNSPDIINMLKREGVTDIDLIVISHGHQDHDGMLEQILEAFNVLKVIKDIDTYQQLTLGSLKLDLYRAPQVYWQDFNDSSIVCGLDYQGKKILLTGDIEASSTRWLLKSLKGEFDILKVPHHGSSNPYFKDLIKQYNAKIALITGGNGKRINKFNVIQELVDTNIPFYDTIMEGELYIHLKNNIFIVETLGE